MLTFWGIPVNVFILESCRLQIFWLYIQIIFLRSTTYRNPLPFKTECSFSKSHPSSFILRCYFCSLKQLCAFKLVSWTLIDLKKSEVRGSWGWGFMDERWFRKTWKKQYSKWKGFHILETTFTNSAS